LPNTLEKRPKKLALKSKPSYLNKKVPFGTFYFGALGARGAFGFAAARGLGAAFGLATGAGCASTTGVGASTLYGASAAGAGFPNKNSLIFVNIMFSYTVIY
jgi:hypothetical protein